MIHKFQEKIGSDEYSVEIPRKFSDGLKRLIIEECNTVIKSIEDADDEDQRHKAVHESRKAFKKIRACLRLARDEIDYYSEENK